MPKKEYESQSISEWENMYDCEIVHHSSLPKETVKEE